MTSWNVFLLKNYDLTTRNKFTRHSGISKFKSLSLSLSLFSLSLSLSHTHTHTRTHSHTHTHKHHSFFWINPRIEDFNYVEGCLQGYLICIFYQDYFIPIFSEIQNKKIKELLCRLTWNWPVVDFIKYIFANLSRLAPNFYANKTSQSQV